MPFKSVPFFSPFPWSVATRSNCHCALLCPIRPLGGLAVWFRLRPQHGQSAQPSADRSPRLAAGLSPPRAGLPAVRTAAGSTHYAHFFYGTYGIATMPVEEV